MKYCKYPVRKFIKEKCSPVIKTPYGDVHTAIYLWRGIVWYQAQKRAGLCISKSTGRKYLSKDCLKQGTLMGKEYYFEDTLNVFLVFLEMPILLKRLSDATNGTMISEEQIATIAKEQVPQYFN